jgi:DNA-binding PadR family transcriptional regulator
MSLTYAVLGLLSEGPLSGFDLIREFDVARSVVWPAPQNEIYRLLANLKADGWIAEREAGARGRRSYALTPAGKTALARWVAEPTDYTLRYDPILKAAFLHDMPPRVRAARARADLDFYEAQLRILRSLERQRKGCDAPDPRCDARRMAIGLYAALAEWCRATLRDAG